MTTTKRARDDSQERVVKRKRHDSSSSSSSSSTSSSSSSESEIVECVREVHRLQSESSLMKSVASIQKSLDQLVSTTTKDNEAMSSLKKEMERIVIEQRRLLEGIVRRLGGNDRQNRESRRGRNRRHELIYTVIFVMLCVHNTCMGRGCVTVKC